jgi:hypothetical protein
MSKDSLVKLAAVLIVAIIFGGAIFYQSQRPVYEGAESKIEHQEKVIQVTEVADGKIVRNIKEGFEVKVPKEWEVSKVNLVQEKIRIDKYGPNQKSETELQDGSILSIYIKDNPDNLSIKEWAKKYWQVQPNELIPLQVDNIPALKTSSKVAYAEDEQQNPLYLDNSLQIDIAFTSNKKYYNFSCQVVSENYQAYSKQCENLIIENIKNYFK